MGTNILIPGNLPLESSLIGVATVELTDAQIKDLPTTAIQIVAAPGSDKYIHVIAASMVCDTSNGGYGNIDPDCVLSFQTSDGEVFCQQIQGSNLTTFLTDNSKRLMLLGTVLDNIYSAFLSSFENSPLLIKIYNAVAGNLTDGNALNIMRLKVYYTVVDLT